MPYMSSALRIQYSHSAGVGRTGTFITLDTMMEKLKERDDVNIFEFITEMRTQRTQMVQVLVSVYVMVRKMLFHPTMWAIYCVTVVLPGGCCREGPCPV